MHTVLLFSSCNHVLGSLSLNCVRLRLLSSMPALLLSWTTLAWSLIVDGSQRQMFLSLLACSSAFRQDVGACSLVSWRLCWCDCFVWRSTTFECGDESEAVGPIKVVKWEIPEVHWCWILFHLCIASLVAYYCIGGCQLFSWSPGHKFLYSLNQQIIVRHRVTYVFLCLKYIVYAHALHMGCLGHRKQKENLVLVLVTKSH